MSVTHYNRLRHQPGSDHVESWFLRANHPERPRALWLKATILGRAKGESVSEAWCSLFDGETPRAKGYKVTVPIGEARFETDTAEIAGCRFDFDPATGGSTGRVGEVSWDLSWKRLPGLLGDPLSMLPSDRLIDGPLPRNKLLTPAPAMSFEGEIRWKDEVWPIEQWLGMQGHNWGRAHSPEYAWGQCVFTDSAGQPFASVEAASGRIVVGGFTSPILALMTVRRSGRTYRFDRLVDVWNRTASIAFPDWTLKMRGPDGEALLSMRARPDRMVCLGYENPDGQLSHCLNSKLASVSLRMNPVNEDAFECRSEHGGALEFLQPDPVAALSEVV